MSLTLLVVSVYGCTVSSIKETHHQCTGTNDLPTEYTEVFEETVDESLLSRAVGDVNKGGLCQGKVYVAKNNVTIPVYRAWNSADPSSRLGKWWAFNLPDGKIAQYRNDYEICHEFSPLDKLIRCNLKANAKIVIGTGQSMKCDSHLTYHASAVRQIYIEIDEKSPAVTDCKEYDGQFSWKPRAD
ncbi:MAG: hypothetical protein EPN21_10115 [Methylococcaceae bacterium]|nr:MAG: hypothetical protein EPN21_10115 [Methylococcaceae bacterium]